MNLKVLAIDPGEKVGWAKGTIDTDDPSLVLDNYGIATMKDFCVTLADRASMYDVIVFEPYIIDAAVRHVGSTVPTLQCVGMIRLCAWLGQALARVFDEPGPQLVESSRTHKPTGRAAAKIHSPQISALIEEALELDQAGRHDEAHHGDALMHLVWYFHNHYSGRP